MRAPFLLLQVAVCLCVLAGTGVRECQGEVFFKETFSDGASWSDRWHASDWRRDEGLAGDWDVTLGDWYGDEAINRGLHTTTNNKFYELLAPVPATLPSFTTEGRCEGEEAEEGEGAEKCAEDSEAKKNETERREFVLQFSVMHQQRIDCGGGYLKLVSKEVSEMSGDAKFHISFGPDICGTSTRHIALSLMASDGRMAHLDRTVEWKVEGGGKTKTEGIRCPTDLLTHVYTLILRSDNTYDVLVDGRSKVKGLLSDDFSFGETTPGHIQREVLEDGGELKAKSKADVFHVADLDLQDIGFVGFDLWQVTAGTIFDNIIITDSVEEAAAFRQQTWGATHLEEAEMWSKANAITKLERDQVRARIQEERRKQDELMEIQMKQSLLEEELSDDHDEL